MQPHCDEYVAGELMLTVLVSSATAITEHVTAWAVSCLLPIQQLNADINAALSNCVCTAEPYSLICQLCLEILLTKAG